MKTAYGQRVLLAALAIAVVFGSGVAGAGGRAATGPIKLDAQLFALNRAQRDGGGTAMLRTARALQLDLVQGLVKVVIEREPSDRNAVGAAVAAAGGKTETESANLTEALLPASALVAVASEPSVTYVRPPFEMALDLVGEGVGVTNAGYWQASGLTGAGVEIAIIDAGFKGYKSLQGVEVPDDADDFTLDYCPTTGFESDEHGTAVAEIVHEIAPDAFLTLICVETEAGLENARSYAENLGVDIISHSVSWFNSSRGDGSGTAGTPDAIVRDARAAGILWVNSAGNRGDLHWSGTFTDANGDTIHEFAPKDRGNAFTLRPLQKVCFDVKWDDWPGGEGKSDQDFDFYVVDSATNTRDVLPNRPQTGTQPPTEAKCVTNTAANAKTYAIEIENVSATTTPRVDLFVTEGHVELEYLEPAGSVTEPGSSPSAMAVGATCWRENTLKSYSSRGPNIAGLTKPDITGPSDVSSASYGLFTACGESGFGGTSAAAPHVAGAAALVKQANPGFGPDELQALLEGRAIDLGFAGKDNGFGAGKLWLGDPPPPSADPGLEDGDLLVGAGVRGEASGTILRVRGNTAEPFCQSPTWSFDPNFWGNPQDVIVDSQGRVVFLASLRGDQDFGLWRCDFFGDPFAELLALLPRTVASDETRPLPFGESTSFEKRSGLHLVRVRRIVVGGGKPKIVTEDAYAFAAVVRDAGGVVEAKTLRLGATTGFADEGGEPPNSSYGGETDMFNAGKYTYAVKGNIVRKTKEPTRIQFGDVGELAFGGYKEERGLIVDDARIPNVPSNCGPQPHPDRVSLDMPLEGGVFHVMDGFEQVVYDRELVLTSTSSAMGTPYLTAVSDALLNDQPEDDQAEHFHMSTAGCAHVASLKYTSILPFWSPKTGRSNAVDRLAPGPFGLVGTQRSSNGNVVLVTPGDDVLTLVSGLFYPTGIAAYPAKLPPVTGNIILVEIKSPVDVLLTDSAGRRIGVDATGGAVNDFGEVGYDSGPGEPRLLAIEDSARGAYSLDFVGTGSGPYTINIYSADFEKPEGNRISITGSASPGAAGEHDFTLSADGELAFVEPPPPPNPIPPPAADRTAPSTQATASPAANDAGWNREDVTVALTATDDGGSGIKEIVYSTGSLATTVSGSSANVTISNEGVTELSYLSRDNAGNTEDTRTLTVRIDKTAPTLAIVASPRQRLATALKRGVKLKATVNERSVLRIQLRLAPELAKKLKLAVIVGNATQSMTGTLTITTKFSAKARRKLAKLRSITLILRTTATDSLGNARAVNRGVTLRR